MIKDSVVELSFHESLRKVTENYNSLSLREKEVFFQMSTCQKASEISKKLGISTKTFESFVDHLKSKLNFQTTLQLYCGAWKFWLDRPE